MTFENKSRKGSFLYVFYNGWAIMDWTILVTIASLVGTVANIYKKQWCFIIWLATNAIWCGYDFYKGLYSQSILFFIYFLLAIWGLRQWRKR